MTIKQSILASLPASVPELCVILEMKTRNVNTHLCQLRDRGMVKRTDREAIWIRGARGPKPHLWERV